MTTPEHHRNPTAGPAPCSCHDSLAATSPTHPGHCCFVPLTQTCHEEEVASWLSRRFGEVRDA